MARHIDPTNLSPSEAQDLGDLIISDKEGFLATKKTYKDVANADFGLLKNLIIDEKNTNPDIKKYYVISKDPNDLLGKGAFSKVRAVSGYVIVDLTKPVPTAEFFPQVGRAVRIKNTKKAEQAHRAMGTKYKHSSAVNDWKIGKEFDHLGMQQPKKVKRLDTLGLFHKKSYSVVNNLPGKELDDDLLIDYISDKGPSTSQIIIEIILPILYAYKHQIADKNYVHRDIKGANIRIALGTNSIVNFLDVDTALKIGEPDTIFGSPGYLAPETQSGNTVSIKRDMFSLGVVLSSCFNPCVFPERYLNYDLQAKDANDALKLAFQEINKNGCYDPNKMLDVGNNNYYDLFEHTQTGDQNYHNLDIDQEQDEIRDLLKSMTNVNPLNRPTTIDEVIDKFEKILQRILVKQQACLPSTSPSP